MVLPLLALGLSIPDGCKHILRKQSSLRTERFAVALLVPACRGQPVFYGNFEGLLVTTFAIMAFSQ